MDATSGKLALRGGKPVRSTPFPKWPVFGEEEISAVKEVFESGAWGIGGTKVNEFEAKFAKLHQTKYGIAVANGTVALEVALKACRVGEGDEVIIPDYTFAATATAVLSVNATPVFVDIDMETFCIDPDKVAAAVTPKTKAIIAVHLGGHPADMDAIMRIASEKNLLVIEDAAQAHFAEWKSKKVGSVGHIGCFSFQSTKNVSSGEGGIVVTNDEKLASRCWSYHNCGRRQGGLWYEHPYLGSNYRMTEFQAAILLAQLNRVESQIGRRERNAERLTGSLQGIKGIKTLTRDKRATVHSHHLFIVKYDEAVCPGVTRDAFVHALSSEGIPATRGYVPLHREGFLSEVKEFTLRSADYGISDYSLVSCPRTEEACRVGIWLPQYCLLGDEKDVDDIAAAFRKVSENVEQLKDIRVP